MKCFVFKSGVLRQQELSEAYYSVAEQKIVRYVLDGKSIKAEDVKLFASEESYLKGQEYKPCYDVPMLRCRGLGFGVKKEEDGRDYKWAWRNGEPVKYYLSDISEIALINGNPNLKDLYCTREEAFGWNLRTVENEKGELVQKGGEMLNLIPTAKQAELIRDFEGMCKKLKEAKLKLLYNTSTSNLYAVNVENVVDWEWGWDSEMPYSFTGQIEECNVDANIMDFNDDGICPIIKNTEE